MQNIERHFSPLIGLPLVGVHMAADMLMLSFGTLRLLPTKRSPDRTVGEYAFHVQCRWEYLGQEANVAELQARERSSPPLLVVAAECGEHDEITIRFSDGSEVLVHTDASDADEQWRLLQPGEATEHIVYGGTYPTV